MSTTAILIDRLPAYLAGPGSPGSLLLATVGTGTLLMYWRDWLLAADVDDIVVVPQRTFDRAYETAIREHAPEARVVGPAGFAEFLRQLEPADRLLFIDARWFTTKRSDLGEVLSTGDPRLVTHMVRLARHGAGTRERVLMDSGRRVRRIERLYAGVTDMDALGVICSITPVSAARRLSGSDQLCLDDLRANLVTAGVPTHDVPAGGPLIDLAVEEGLLCLNEQILTRCAEAGLRPSARQLAPDIWVSPSARIHPTSRLYGPAILQPDVRVDAGVRLIGPIVIGAGARIGADAILSRCVVSSMMRVPAGTRIAGRVLVPGRDNSTKSEPAGWAQLLAAADTGGSDGSSHAPGATGPKVSRAYSICKRGFDLAAASCGLFVLSPLLLLVAMLVKLTSAGPVLFGHEREGRGGKAFRCWKFRTMVYRAHAQQRRLYAQNLVDGPQFKLPHDPRVTPLGRILRTMNIDELPQLLNVVRGEMSLIGPRPSPFRENQICVPWRQARLSVRPGITGLWQVCRRDRACGDFHQWIYFDVLYARHRSFALDLRILLATFLTLAGRWSVPLSWMIPDHHARRMAAGSDADRDRSGCAWRLRSVSQAHPLGATN